MKVILAEKPSVALDIAAVLGACNKREGHYEGNDYAVTYAFGHLVTIAEPEEMNSAWAKPWKIEQLPMLPAEWKYRIADKAETQFRVIQKLFCDPTTTTIICATDAGREGEHIFRLIYQLSGSNKPVQRLWISSLTVEAIREGFRKLKSSKDFDDLAAAAAARAHADWIVGLNFTRAYTIINNQLCTIGRVQTPTLALIVERQNEIDKFISTPYYEIIATFEGNFTAKYMPTSPGEDPHGRLTDKAAAQSILGTVDPIRSGFVQTVTTIEKKNNPPALFDLLTLQKEANRRFGYTAQETLDIAQTLYEEHKVLSYPRTESRHLSTDMVNELPRILSSLLNSPLTTQQMRDAFILANIAPGNITGDLLRPKLGKSYVDDTKLTDHHAIIPTHKPAPPDLPEKQRNVYQLVAIRFLGIFLPPEVRDETTAILTIAGFPFQARGIVIKEPGWTVLDPKDTQKEEKEKQPADDTQQLPPLVKGQQVTKLKTELREGKTAPPKLYDDASLLGAMKNAGKELDDEDLAAYMKQSGLGTPATRAAIIERLLSTGYVERKKKSLIPTAKGIALINQVHPDLKNVALTASWEQRLSEMQDGKLALTTFENNIKGFVARILPTAIRDTAPIPITDASGLAACPLCKQGVVRMGAKSASCNRWKEGCTFSIWKEQHGKQLSESQITDLIKNRKTRLIKGFKKKSGTGTYDARLMLTDEFKVRLEFDDTSKAAKQA